VLFIHKIWVSKRKEKFSHSLKNVEITFLSPSQLVVDCDNFVIFLLLMHVLDLQTFFVKMTMAHNLELILQENNDLNLGFSTKFLHPLSSTIKKFNTLKWLR
jgi:hypothetical protein